MFLTFLRSNMPSRDDLRWLAKGGGLFGGGEPPSHRFNAGEKLVFWGGVFILGALVVSTGLVLDKVIPGLDYLRGDMQVAHMGHSICAILMMAVFLGHIYIGTIGMSGAYRAMKTRLCRRRLGPRAPPLLVRGHPGRQDPGRTRSAVGAGQQPIA